MNKIVTETKITNSGWSVYIIYCTVIISEVKRNKLSINNYSHTRTHPHILFIQWFPKLAVPPPWDVGKVQRGGEEKGGGRGAVRRKGAVEGR